MKKFNIVVQSDTEDCARQKVLDWYAHLPNLTVDEVTPYKNGGYQVWISYDEETNTK